MLISALGVSGSSLPISEFTGSISFAGSYGFEREACQQHEAENLCELGPVSPSEHGKGNCRGLESPYCVFGNLN